MSGSVALRPAISRRELHFVCCGRHIAHIQNADAMSRFLHNGSSKLSDLHEARLLAWDLYLYVLLFQRDPFPSLSKKQADEFALMGPSLFFLKPVNKSNTHLRIRGLSLFPPLGPSGNFWDVKDLRAETNNPILPSLWERPKK